MGNKNSNIVFPTVPIKIKDEEKYKDDLTKNYLIE